MRKFVIISLAVLALGAVSCNKQEAGASDSLKGSEIVLGLGDGVDVSVETKATAVTSISGTYYFGATTGTSTEATKYSKTSATVSSNKIATGKYQTATPTAYNWYVTNSSSLSVGANTTVSAANGTDVVCGRAAASTSTTPAVTLEHIFARTGTVSASCAASDASLSSVSYTIIGKSDINGTAGTYNLKTAAWTAASTKLTTATALTGTSDMYLIPGTYTIVVTYTYTRGDYVNTFTKSADVTLQKGKIHNIAITVPDAGSAIQISLTLTAWSSTTLNVTAS